MLVHSATLSSDEADSFTALVSSLSVDDRDLGTTDLLADTPVVNLVDYFAALPDPRDLRWVTHPLAVVLTLCACAVVAGMTSDQQTAPMSSQLLGESAVIGMEGLLRLVDVVERMKARGHEKSASWTQSGASAPDNAGQHRSGSVGEAAAGQPADGGALAGGDHGQGGDHGGAACADDVGDR